MFTAARQNAMVKIYDFMIFFLVEYESAATEQKKKYISRVNIDFSSSNRAHHDDPLILIDLHFTYIRDCWLLWRNKWKGKRDREKLWKWMM